MVANPASADAADEEKPAVSRADVEAAIAAAPDGSAAALQLVDPYYAAQLGEVDRRLAGEGSVLGVFARMTEAPSNWHQATVFALGSDAPEDAALKARAPAMFGLVVFMVALQCMTMPRLFILPANSFKMSATLVLG